MHRSALPCFLFGGALLVAQTPEPLAKPTPPPKSFTVVKEVKHTPPKHQGPTSTCWAFATTSFLESELMRMGKGEHDLSIMFSVRHAWPRKADMVVRLRGKQVLSPGGQAHDVMDSVREHGLVPTSAYTGLQPEAKGHDHGAMEKELNAWVAEQVKVQRPAPTWKDGMQPILDKGLGVIPEQFSYQGKTYTPKGFAQAMGINPDDYVELTSYTHHAFYKPSHLDVMDNWSHNAMYYNVPLDDFQAATEYALTHGYSVTWDGGLFRGPGDPSTFVSQEMRQEHFDDFRVGDDHLMHLVGLAKDADGALHFKIKDSYGTKGPNGGYHYLNVPSFRLCTVSLMFHKQALPPALAKKLGIPQSPRSTKR